MIKLARIARGAALTLALGIPAKAQTYHDAGATVVNGVAPLIGCSGTGQCAGPVSQSNPMPVTGAFSASLGGFTPSASGARMTALPVTTSDSSGALPTGTVTVVSNVGSNPMYCNVNAVAATTADQLIAASSWFAFTIPSGVTALHCIATGGSTTADGVGGAGLPTGTGGGGGGGSTPTGSAGSPNTSVVSVQGISGGTALPVSGSFWQSTQPVSLASLPALAAGSNTVGSIANTSFGISGTLPAFAATPTVNVGTFPALATGSNTIGAVTQGGTWTVQPGNTANTTAWLVTGAGGTFPATESGTWNITNISGTISLPTGAATAANQEVTAAGTSAASAQAVQGVTGGVAMPMSAASLPLPTGAATSANQTNASQKTQIVDGSGNVIASTSNNLDVQCANCSGSGVSTADEAAFAGGSSLFAGSGGFFQTTPTNNALTTGQQGLFQVTANRALFSNLRNASGTEVGTATTPLQVTGANGTFPATESGTWNLTNITGTVSLPTGAATSALQTTGNTALTTINTTLGSPFQAGGSIGNTTFASTQSGAWNLTNVTGTVSLPTGAATSANQPTNAAIASTTSGQTGNLNLAAVTTSAPSYTTGQTDPLSMDTAGNLRTVDKADVTQGSTTSGQVGNLMQGAVTTSSPSYTTAQTSPLSLDTAGNLRVNVVTGGGSGGTSAADAATWTAGTTSQTPIGCEYTSGGATALVTAHIGTLGCTTARAAFTDKSSVAGIALSAAVSAYGTAPTGTEVEGVNAFITNANGNGQAANSGSSPVTLSTTQTATTAAGTAPTQGISALGMYLSSPPTLITGQSEGLLMDSSGNLNVHIQAGAGSGGTALADNSAFTQSTTTETPIGCLYKSAYTAAASGNSTIARCDSSGQLILGAGSSTIGALTANQSVNLAQIGGTSTSSSPLMVAASTAPVTATNAALTVDLRPDSPGIVTLGQTTKSASVPVTWASDQVGTAGSAATTVLTVQGAASMTPVASNITQSGGTTLVGTAGTVPASADPCSYAKKSFAAISVASATTTSLVSVSGSTTVYVCGFSISIARSATTAATAKLEYGTSTTCTGPVAMTGTYGSNDAAVSTTPTQVDYGNGSATVAASAASNGVCILTAGNAVFVQGVLTYVQQ